MLSGAGYYSGEDSDETCLGEDGPPQFVLPSPRSRRKRQLPRYLLESLVEQPKRSTSQSIIIPFIHSVE